MDLCSGSVFTVMVNPGNDQVETSLRTRFGTGFIKRGLAGSTFSMVHVVHEYDFWGEIELVVRTDW